MMKTKTGIEKQKVVKEVDRLITFIENVAEEVSKYSSEKFDMVFVIITIPQ